MKVIFLDVDGVLNNTQTFLESPFNCCLDDYCLKQLCDILEKIDAKIVISSSWRHDAEDLQFLMDKLKELKIDTLVIGQTPYVQHSWRALEIRAYLQEHPEITRWAVLDDSSDADLKDGSFFQTKMDVGLTDLKAYEIIKYLNA